jgi:hypothetical protein
LLVLTAEPGLHLLPPLVKSTINRKSLVHNERTQWIPPNNADSKNVETKNVEAKIVES